MKHMIFFDIFFLILRGIFVLKSDSEKKPPNCFCNISLISSKSFENLIRVRYDRYGTDNYELYDTYDKGLMRHFDKFRNMCM